LGVRGAHEWALPVVETDRPEAQIYQLRAVLRGISPLIWRRLLVRSDSTVARLHEVLQIAFGWDDEHLNHFEIRGREYAFIVTAAARSASMPELFDSAT
jgi:hypothetical protein